MSELLTPQEIADILKVPLRQAQEKVLRSAVEIYETILLASSPQQMVEAVDLRMKALKGQTMETLEESTQ